MEETTGGGRRSRGRTTTPGSLVTPRRRTTLLRYPVEDRENARWLVHSYGTLALVCRLWTTSVVFRWKPTGSQSVKPWRCGDSASTLGSAFSLSGPPQGTMGSSQGSRRQSLDRLFPSPSHCSAGSAQSCLSCPCAKGYKLFRVTAPWGKPAPLSQRSIHWSA